MLVILAALCYTATALFNVGDRVGVTDTGDRNAFLSGTVINVISTRIGRSLAMHEFYEIRLANDSIIREHSASMRIFKVKLVDKGWFTMKCDDRDVDPLHPFQIGTAVRVADNSSFWNGCCGNVRSYAELGARILSMVRLEFPYVGCSSESFKHWKFPQKRTVAFYCYMLRAV